MSGLLGFLNLISFFLGPAYIIEGGRSGNMARIGFGVLLFASAIVDFGLPQPIEGLLQLVAAVCGAFVRAP